MFVFPVGPLFRMRVSHHLDPAPFPHPAHQTGRADFRHPAFGQGLLNGDSHPFAHETIAATFVEAGTVPASGAGIGQRSVSFPVPVSAAAKH